MPSKSLCLATIALLSSAFAFQMKSMNVPASKKTTSFASEGETIPLASEINTPVPAAPKKVKRINAQWLPIGGVLAPVVLDGTLAADAGFDPIGFSKNKASLYWMREAEVKHGRLAMLAAIGWPLSELWHKNIAQMLGLDSILAGKSGELAPSLLNGGLSSVYASGMLVMSIIIAGLLEGQAMNKGDIFVSNDKPEGYIAGDYGFDPLNLYSVRGNKKVMEATEIKNGRLAMVAITLYAFSEFVTKVPVIQQTPFLF